MARLPGASSKRRLGSSRCSDGLLHLLVDSHIDRQLTVVVPCIQVRSVDHEQLSDFKMTSGRSSIVEGSQAVMIGLIPVGTLL